MATGDLGQRTGNVQEAVGPGSCTGHENATTRREYLFSKNLVGLSKSVVPN